MFTVSKSFTSMLKANAPMAKWLIPVTLAGTYALLCLYTTLLSHSRNICTSIINPFYPSIPCSSHLFWLFFDHVFSSFFCAVSCSFGLLFSPVFPCLYKPVGWSTLPWLITLSDLLACCLLFPTKNKVDALENLKQKKEREERLVVLQVCNFSSVQGEWL